MRWKRLLKRGVAWMLGLLTTLTAGGLVACGMTENSISNSPTNEEYCNVTINGNAPVKVAYHSQLFDLFSDLPDCTIVSVADSTTNGTIALDSLVMKDLNLTVEYTVEHVYKNGECIYCEEVCEQHSWTNGVCSTCTMSCPHSSYKDFLCEICELSTSTTYNACDTIADMQAYGSATGSNWKNVTEGLEYEQTMSAAGKNGSFLRLHIGRNENGVGVYWVGITIAPNLTLEQIKLLKAMGYTRLSVDYYFEHTNGAPVDTKLVYSGRVYEYGIDYSATEYLATHPREGKAVGQWQNFKVNINTIIGNYDGLANGTKYLMLIINYKDYGDNAYTPQLGYGTFYTYFGNMEFIK